MFVLGIYFDYNKAAGKESNCFNWIAIQSMILSEKVIALKTDVEEPRSPRKKISSINIRKRLVGNGSKIVLYRDSFHEIKWRSIFFNCRAMFDIYRQWLLKQAFDGTGNN